MNLKSLFILCLFPVILTAENSNDALRFITGIYSRYRSDDFNPLGSGADSIFSPNLLKLIQLDQQFAGKEVGYLDGDPLCDCQEYKRLKVVKIQLRTSGEKTYAKVAFRNFKMIHKVTLILTQIKGRWLIDDIAYTDSENIYTALYNYIKNTHPKALDSKKYKGPP